MVDYRRYRLKTDAPLILADPDRRPDVDYGPVWIPSEDEPEPDKEFAKHYPVQWGKWDIPRDFFKLLFEPDPDDPNIYDYGDEPGKPKRREHTEDS